METRNLLKPSRIATGQQETRHDAICTGNQAALCADRRQCIRQMLRRADSPGCAMNDDADFLDGHARFSIMLRRRRQGRRGRTGELSCPATSFV